MTRRHTRVCTRCYLNQLTSRDAATVPNIYSIRNDKRVADVSLARYTGQLTQPTLEVERAAISADGGNVFKEIARAAALNTSLLLPQVVAED